MTMAVVGYKTWNEGLALVNFIFLGCLHVEGRGCGIDRYSASRNGAN